MDYRFGDYTLDTERYELRRAGALVKLRPKVFDVLAYLIAHRDRIVSKQELIEQLWPQQFVAEATLNSCIWAARQAVGDTGQAQQVIQTRHSHGYRFVATVTLCDLPPADQMPRVSLPTDAPGEPGQEWPSRVDGMTAHATSIAALPPPALSPLQQSLAGEQKMVTVLVCQLAPLAPLPSGTQRQAAEVRHQAMQTLCTLALEAIQGSLLLDSRVVACEDDVY
jgi:DNA-binding winged helix-turn-helix (wHTH) protein